MWPLFKQEQDRGSKESSCFKLEFSDAIKGPRGDDIGTPQTFVLTAISLSFCAWSAAHETWFFPFFKQQFKV